MSDRPWIMSDRSNNYQKQFALCIYLINLLLTFSNVSTTKAEDENSFLVKEVSVYLPENMSKNHSSWMDGMELCRALPSVDDPEKHTILRSLLACKQQAAGHNFTNRTVEIHLYFARNRLPKQESCSDQFTRRKLIHWLHQPTWFEQLPVRNLLDGMQTKDISVFVFRIEIQMQEHQWTVSNSMDDRKKSEIMSFVLPKECSSKYWIDVQISRRKPLFSRAFLSVKLVLDNKTPPEVVDAVKSLERTYSNHAPLLGFILITSARAVLLESKDREPFEGYPKPVTLECQSRIQKSFNEIQLIGLLPLLPIHDSQQKLETELYKVQHALKERNNIRIGMDANIELFELDEDSERLKKIYLYANAVTGSNREIRSEVELITKAVCNQSLGVGQMFPNGCIAFATHKMCTVYDPPLPVISLLVTGEVLFEDRALNWENVLSSSERLHKDAREACEVILRKILQEWELTELMEYSRFEGFTNHNDKTNAHFTLYLNYINLINKRDVDYDDEDMHISQELTGDFSKHTGFRYEIDSASEVNTYVSTICDDSLNPNGYITVNQEFSGHKIEKLISWPYKIQDHSELPESYYAYLPFKSRLDNTIHGHQVKNVDNPRASLEQRNDYNEDSNALSPTSNYALVFTILLCHSLYI